MLVVGKSGSGKSYFLYSLLAQSVMAFGFQNIWTLDPKNSSLSVLGKKIHKKKIQVQTMKKYWKN